MNAPAPDRRHDDLRDLVATLDAMGELERVDGAHWDLEIGALSELVAATNPGRSPALLFDRIPGYPAGHRILSGAANAYRRLAYILGLPEPRDEIALVKSLRAKMAQSFGLLPPHRVADGPLFENIDRDDEVDLWKFPVPRVHELDGGRYIGTDDMVIMRDPDSGWVNGATYRTMVHDKNTAAIWMSPGKHGRLISQKYFDQGKPCPVAIVCGQDPLLFLSAHQEIGQLIDEIAHAGGQRGRPFDVVESELHGLPLPAHAELVIEGEIDPTETRLEGPFGEFMGYYASSASNLPVVRIRRVYYRNDPIITIAIPSRPPENFTFARAAVKSALIWEQMELAGVPGVKGVWCHEAGAGRLFNVVAIEQRYPGHATQAGMAAASCHAGNYAGRWVVVVDDDIDPSNMFDVVWAMSTRCDPPEDVQFFKRAWSTPLDPILRGPPYHNNRAIIDCCRPYGWQEEFPKVAEASPELKRQVMARWPRLFGR